LKVIEIHRVTPERLADLEELFESRGTLRGCRCMIFRAGVNGKVPPPSGPARKKAMRALVQSGIPVGLLGYSEGTPVAWCSVAPRTTFPGLIVVGARDDPVWSLTCFYIRPEFRGEGLQRKLLDAAIQEARTRGAKALEAYPVEPSSPSYRFGGFIPFFERAGFREVGRLGSRRNVMRRQIRPSRSRR
jgi:GNAT superfamily N-acetyltransferase